MQNNDTPEFDPLALATPESLLDIIKTLTSLANKAGDGWENLRFEMVRFSGDILKAWQGEHNPTIKDIVPKLWGFYCGYMACHQEWAREIESLLEESETVPM